MATLVDRPARRRIGSARLLAAVEMWLYVSDILRSGSGPRISTSQSQEVVDLLTKAKDFSLVLEDRPGTLAKVAGATAMAGINIDGFSGASECGDTFHLLFIRDADRARSALESAGYRITKERDVALVDVEDRPGTAAAELNKLAQQELNVDLLYLATNNRMVIGGQEFQRIWEALGAASTKAAR